MFYIPLARSSLSPLIRGTQGGYFFVDLRGIFSHQGEYFSQLKRYNQMIIPFMAPPLRIELRAQDLESWILTVKLWGYISSLEIGKSILDTKSIKRWKCIFSDKIFYFLIRINNKSLLKKWNLRSKFWHFSINNF